MTDYRVALRLAYDGTQFSGWAVQPGLRTVQDTIEQALAVVLRRSRDEVRLTVAGRTDAGVHARGQVAHLDVSETELERWTGKAADTVALDSAEAGILRGRKLNGVLRRNSPDVVIYAADVAPMEFDARFSALWRRYEYRIRVGAVSPLDRFYTVSVPQEIDFAVLQRVSSGLLGLRDFGAFCKPREGATTVRTLTHFSWETDGAGGYIAHIQADAFCHSMVRSLVGAVVAAAIGRLSEDDLPAIADAAVRSNKFSVMPAHGLSLEEIGYPDPSEYASRAEQTRARRDD